MKTNFALGLTQDGITLWQRDASGWLRVGAVALDDPDMDGAMATLVETAHKLSPSGLTTKLVIPEDQFLMTEIHAPGPGRDVQEAQIRAALVGRTPFPVEELVFDWSGAGANVAVAVVARETLLEAEDFASAQGLNPVAFVAAAAPTGFHGEPFLGLTRAARAKRIDPDAVDRDTAVLRETGMARLPEPPAPVVEPAPVPVREPAPATEPKPVVDPVAVVDPAPADAPKTTVDSAADAPDTTPVKADDPVGPEAVKAPSNPLAPKLEPLEKKPAPEATGTVLSGLKPKETVDTDTSDATPSLGFRTRRQNGVPPTVPPKSKPAPTAENTPARAAKPDARGALPAPLSRLGDTLRARYSQTNAALTTQVSALKSALSRGKDKSDPKTLEALGTALAKPPVSAPAQPDRAAPKAAETAPRPSALSALAARAGKATSALGAPAQGKAPQSSPTPPRQSPLETLRKVQATPQAGNAGLTNADEAQRLTVFGARATSTDLGKPPVPRQALLISGGVLLILISAAVWAFYFMAAAPDRSGIADGAPSSLPDVAAPAPLPEDVIEPLEPTELAAIEAALGQSDAAQTDRGAEDGTEGGATSDTNDEPAVTETGAAALVAPSDPAAEALQAPPSDLDAGRVAEVRSNAIIPPQDLSGILPAPVPPAPFGADPLPPLRGSPEAQALAALPDTAPVDAAPALTDEISEAISQATGGQLPAGEEALDIGVTTGAPPSTPPAKPARFSQPETPPADPEPEAAAPTVPEVPADQAEAPAAPALPSEDDLDIQVTQGSPAAVPPRRVDPAPPAAPPPAEGEISPQGSLVPPPAATDAALPTDTAAAPALALPLGGVALSSFRPLARPSDLRSTPAQPEVSETEFANATAQAVPISIRPASRPSEFAQVVQRALRAATPRQTTAAPPAAEAVQTAAAAAMPSLPTSTSVAREATVSRAINLRQVNLLGVMGTTSNRRALVRLSNGRVVTVRVGERLDDGQVTAIGDNELRYVRSGRDVVLRIAS